MSDPKPIMRPADIRRAVSEWASQGFNVRVMPDGTLEVAPAAIPQPPAIDLIDFKR